MAMKTTKKAAITAALLASPNGLSPDEVQKLGALPKIQTVHGTIWSIRQGLQAQGKTVLLEEGRYRIRELSQAPDGQATGPTADSIVGYVSAHPGSKSHEIQKGLGLTRHKLLYWLAKLKANRIHVRKHKYYLAGPLSPEKPRPVNPAILEMICPGATLDDVRLLNENDRDVLLNAVGQAAFYKTVATAMLETNAQVRKLQALGAAG